MPSPDFQPTVLLRSEESDDEVSMIENTVPPGWAGPPLHHHDFDEAFYILTGELTFQLGDELRTAGPGAFAFAPRGIDHTLANLSDGEARYLIVCTPGGFERYFDLIAAEQAGVEPPATASKPYPETIVVGPAIGADRERGARISPAAGGVNVLLRSAESGGRVSIMDNSIGASSSGPPLHLHDFDEAFYVVEGELTFQLEDRLVKRRRGELAFARRNVAHTFANPSAAGARTLIVCTPAGFERYFDRIAARQAGVDPPASAMEPWPEVIKVGPPIDIGSGVE